MPKIRVIRPEMRTRIFVIHQHIFKIFAEITEIPASMPDIRAPRAAIFAKILRFPEEKSGFTAAT
jgi:hypothetical protein